MTEPTESMQVLSSSSPESPPGGTPSLESLLAIYARLSGLVKALQRKLTEERRLSMECNDILNKEQGNICTFDARCSETNPQLAEAASENLSLEARCQIIEAELEKAINEMKVLEDDISRLYKYRQG